MLLSVLCGALSGHKYPIKLHHCPFLTSMWTPIDDPEAYE